jgi:hypothetical protein
MLVIVFELFWTGVGVLALTTGRVSVFGHWVVEGIAARIIGLLLMTPFTVPFVLGFLRGWEAGKQGREIRLEDCTDLGLLEIGLWVGCFALAGLISLVAARRPGKQVDPEEEWKRLRASGQVEPADALREENPLRRR